MPTPLYDFGGSGPVIHLAVANGFPPQTYAPLLAPLTDRFRVVSLIPRPMWPDVPPPHPEADWPALADDLLAGLAEHNLTEVIALGHSLGATTSALAAVKEPGRIRALAVLDPTFFTPMVLLAFKFVRALGREVRIPLAAKAMIRRARFANVDEAFAYWRGKPLFTDWSDEALRLYAESMTRPAPEGGLELSWRPEWEAHIYSAFYDDTWSMLRKLRGKQPVLALRGGTSDTFPAASARYLRRILPNNVQVDEIPGYGHLFPQAAPDLAREPLARWLNALPGR